MDLPQFMACGLSMDQQLYRLRLQQITESDLLTLCMLLCQYQFLQLLHYLIKTPSIVSTQHHQMKPKSSSPRCQPHIASVIYQMLSSTNSSASFLCTNLAAFNTSFLSQNPFNMKFQVPSPGMHPSSTISSKTREALLKSPLSQKE